MPARHRVVYLISQDLTRAPPFTHGVSPISMSTCGHGAGTGFAVQGCVGAIGLVSRECTQRQTPYGTCPSHHHIVANRADRGRGTVPTRRAAIGRAMRGTGTQARPLPRTVLLGGHAPNSCFCRNAFCFYLNFDMSFRSADVCCVCPSSL